MTRKINKKKARLKEQSQKFLTKPAHNKYTLTIT